MKDKIVFFHIPTQISLLVNHNEYYLKILKAFVMTPETFETGTKKSPQESIYAFSGQVLFGKLKVYQGLHQTSHWELNKR